MGGVNLAVITCNRSPWEGALRFMTHKIFPLPKQIDVIPQYLMRTMMRELMAENIKIMRQNEELFPQNMIFLRSGASDSLFRSIISKEVAGIKQAMNGFIKEHKVFILELMKWKKYSPGIMYTIVQENVDDVFARDNVGKYEPMRQPMLINDGVTSGEWLDIFMSDVYNQECSYLRVLRWITLWNEYHVHDENGTEKFALANDERLLSDYYQIIYSQFYGYAPGIPWFKKPKLPAPLLYAQHAANWEYEIMTELDTDLRRMNIDITNSKPKLCQIDTSDVDDNEDVNMM